METKNKNSQTTKTVEVAFQMLEYLKERDGSTLRGITEEFGIAKSTAYRHMITLKQLGYVVKEGGVYYPSLRFLDFSEYVQKRKQLFRLAKSKVAELATETGEQVHFLVEEHGKGITVHHATGSHAVETNPGLGKYVYLHTPAAGKAILAQMSHEEVNTIIDQHGLPAKTEHSITTSEELYTDLEVIRERGYSTNKQERTEGLRAIGAPVNAPNDFVFGALSVSGPANRMKGERFNETLPNLLRGTTNELALNINSVTHIKRL